MVRLWQQIMKEEKGQALPIVLALLVLGGLLIAPSLNYAATGLHAGQIVKENVKGVYAADAGVEDALWDLINDLPASDPYQLPENVNQMQVDIQTENKGTYALYFGEPIEVSGKHYDYLAVDGNIVPVGDETYEYTITVTWQPESGYPKIKMEEVGVRLPIGYSYVLDSAASFADNLSLNNPDDDTPDGAGAHMLGWEFPSPRPEVSDEEPTATQTFYVTGEGELEGDYTWVVAAESDVAIVSEATGTLYRITATATRPEGGETTARVVADVMLHEGTGETRIIYWQANPQ